MSTRGRLTRRGRLVVTGAVLLVAVGTGAVVAGEFLSGPECRVVAGERSIGLSRAEAEAVTTAFAPRVRQRATPAATVVRRTVPGISPDDAAVVIEAVSGQRQAALTCDSGGAGTSEPDRLDGSGLTARAERVRSDVRARFGDLPLGGFAPGGVRSGHMPGSAHYEGRAVDTFFRPINEANRTRGWALAQYLVAHASRLAVQTVIYDDRIWTANRADQGWRAYRVSTAGKSAAVAAVLEHRDHVHYDVTD